MAQAYTAEIESIEKNLDQSVAQAQTAVIESRAEFRLKFQPKLNCRN